MSKLFGEMALIDLGKRADYEYDYEYDYETARRYEVAR